ncbi:MAG TPA: hypothetical protein VNO31_01420 [Umezawaea sp.]|nr:hypothetical protein [Umezawaea sp.]
MSEAGGLRVGITVEDIATLPTASPGDYLPVVRRAARHGWDQADGAEHGDHPGLDPLTGGGA